MAVLLRSGVADLTGRPPILVAIARPATERMNPLSCGSAPEKKKSTGV
jgi:hypothetical protein